MNNDRKKMLINVSKFLSKDEEIIDIINVCGLDPINSWREWTDHCGNSIIIPNNKKPIINRYKERNPIIKDIHFKSTLLQLSRQSDWAMVTFARSVKEMLPSVSFVWLYGIDKILRLACNLKGEWIENQLPLSCSLTTLRTIVKHLTITEPKVILGYRDVRCPFHTEAIKTWITPWPPNKQTQLDMLMTNKFLATDILKGSDIIK